MPWDAGQEGGHQEGLLCRVCLTVCCRFLRSGGSSVSSQYLLGAIQGYGTVLVAGSDDLVNWELAVRTPGI